MNMLTKNKSLAAQKMARLFKKLSPVNARFQAYRKNIHGLVQHK